MKTKRRRSATGQNADGLPDGLSEEHLHAPGGWRRRGGLLAILALSLLMVAALLGLAGVEETLAEDSEVATVSWHAPARMRNGEFFEMRLQVEAHEPIAQLVVGVDAALWEDFTINTLFPAPAEEASEEGELLFTFGPLDAGGSFLMKVDAQINPDMLWRNEGTVTVYDGEEPIAELPIVMEVLP